MSEALDNFEKWFTDNLSYFSYGEYFDGENPPKISIQTLLGLEENNLKPFTKDALEYLKDNESANELNWGLRAYSQFQDLFGVSLQNDTPIWNRHYCYYESLVYLNESIIAWLDQNVLSAMTLLRPFLELSVFHLYWYLRCESEDYIDFYLWLEGKKGKPPFKNQLDYIINNIPTKKYIHPQRLKRIQVILSNSYKGASIYNHTPKVDESIVSMNAGTNKVSFFTFFYYIANANIILRQLVYLYILVYPMALFPVDRYKKWGYGGPLGLYFDHVNYAILSTYLGSENVQKMQHDFHDLQDIKDLFSWYDSQKNLSESEIEATWREFISDKPKMNVEKKELRMTLFKASGRSVNWFTNYFHEMPKPDDQISDEMIERISKRMKNW